MHLYKSCTWFPIFMLFWVGEALKLSNLSKWDEQPKSCTCDENSTKNWKNELDFTWKDFDSRSWRNKSHSILRCISWDSIENKFFTIHDEKVGPTRFDERKVRSLVKKWFCVLEWCEKFKFYYFGIFSHFTSFDEMKILRNSNKILSTLKNIKQALTLSLSSCSPKLKCENEA